ncbi:hypothetical protein B0H14DRAFT_3690913 [Mycena olivaceomarginata]|nr:hypothetical protein B0H14DRAFT_3690913 [Mycena olivaceomarginata]
MQTSSNNSTCLITPEVTQGPYHVLGESVHQNITENQLGIPLEVLIDFVDISTCEPVEVWVNAWHANATSFYGGYIAETGSTISAGRGGSGGASGNSSLSMSMPMSMSGFGPSMASSASTAAASATYGATSGADSTSNSMLDTAVDDNSTFLRGVFQSEYVPLWRRDVPDNMWDPYQAAPGYNSNLDITWAGSNISDRLLVSITVGLNIVEEDFTQNLQSGGVTPEKKIKFLETKTEAHQRGNEYREKIESYKRTSWFNLPKKLKKKEDVRRAKRAIMQSNNLLRNQLDEMRSGADWVDSFSEAGEVEDEATRAWRT